MLYYESIWRAFVWLIIGTVFGLASLLLIFAASAIFTHPIGSVNIIDANVVMFLCVSLMSGAGGDFFLSDIANWGTRVAVFLVTVIALLIVYFLFNPNNVSPPASNIVYGFSVGYAVATFFYCVSLKTIIFYKERLTNKKLKF